MNLLDKYGIKEVADVTIYELNEFGELGKPVLFLDTLKISNIEIEKEEVKHYGGTSHSLIIDWSYVSGVNISIEDALFSPKSLAMLCGGKITEDEKQILKTEVFRATGGVIPEQDKNGQWNSISGWNNKFKTRDNKEYYKINPKFYDSTGNEITFFFVGELYYCTYYLNSKAITIEITPDSFPGYYCLIGSTYARSMLTGKDEIFYFVVPKAKLIPKFTLDFNYESSTNFAFDFIAMKHKHNEFINLILVTNEGDIDRERIEAILNKGIIGSMKIGTGTSKFESNILKETTLESLVLN
jgi:hypothetical protein